VARRHGEKEAFTPRVSPSPRLPLSHSPLPTGGHGEAFHEVLEKVATVKGEPD